VGDVLAPFLSQQKLPFYLLLTGDLGAGKTTLTKMLLKKMGVQETITSPTFVILNQYQTPSRTINHMDAYRLDQNQDLAMYFEEFDQGLNIIE
jgi:tRNA threonylcarbamoyladenosine biosynthesis protein TsaE